MMPPRKQKKVARILQQLVVPTITDEEDGSASQQPSPISRVETPCSSVVGASLLLLSDASPSIVAPRTEDLPGPPQSTDSPLATPQASSQPASQPASELPTKRKSKGRGKKSTPSLDIDPSPGRSQLSTTEVAPQGLLEQQATVEVGVPVPLPAPTHDDEDVPVSAPTRDDEDVPESAPTRDDEDVPVSHTEEKLVDWFRDNVLLYDKRHVEYKNRSMRDRLVREIATEIGRTESYVLHWMRGMRTMFVKLRKRCGKSGQASSAMTSRQLWTLRSFSFLDSHLRVQSSSMTLGMVNIFYIFLQFYIEQFPDAFSDHCINACFLLVCLFQKKKPTASASATVTGTASSSASVNISATDAVGAELSSDEDESVPPTIPSLPGDEDVEDPPASTVKPPKKRVRMTPADRMLEEYMSRVLHQAPVLPPPAPTDEKAIFGQYLCAEMQKMTDDQFNTFQQTMMPMLIQFRQQRNPVVSHPLQTSFQQQPQQAPILTDSLTELFNLS